MKSAIIRKNKKLGKVLEWFIYLFSYIIILLIMQYFFNIVIINSNYKILYFMLAVTLIYILNKTVAPIILDLTIPLTAVTYGMFYFVINTLIIKTVGLILYNKVDFISFGKLFLITILISLINLIMELTLIKPFLRRFK